MKIVSINPSRNYEILGEVEFSSKREVLEAVKKAKKAFLLWSTLSLQERCNKLASFIEASKKRAEEIAQLIAKETGRPIKSSRANVEGGFEYFEAYIQMAEKYLSPETTFETTKTIHKVYHEPRGVIATICPWNYPYMNIAWQCGQALIAGNTIVYKNSSENQLFVKLLEDLIKESNISEGVFNVLYGDSSVGDYLVHQDIDMISFTGSSKVGQILTKIAAEKFIPIVTELGGSSPLILFEDMKITDELISYISDRRFKNAGQACDAVKRLIVHKSLFYKVSKKLANYVSKLKIGDALNEDTEVGPLVAKRQVKLIEEQVKDAVKKGAKVLTGGKKPKNLKGAYYLPTILVSIKKICEFGKKKLSVQFYQLFHLIQNKRRLI